MAHLIRPFLSIQTDSFASLKLQSRYLAGSISQRVFSETVVHSGRKVQKKLTLNFQNAAEKHL